MDLKEVVAINLRRLRHAKGMTQEQLAEQAGLSVRYIGGIERECVGKRYSPGPCCGGARSRGDRSGTKHAVEGANKGADRARTVPCSPPILGGGKTRPGQLREPQPAFQTYRPSLRLLGIRARRHS